MALRIEFRSDSVLISGYVNATEKKSRPVITPHGKVIEVIEPRAFEGAIARAGNITVTVDHDSTHFHRCDGRKATDADIASLARLAAIPLMIVIESSLNRDLLLEKEKDEYYFAFDKKSCSKGI